MGEVKSSTTSLSFGIEMVAYILPSPRDRLKWVLSIISLTNKVCVRSSSIVSCSSRILGSFLKEESTTVCGLHCNPHHLFALITVSKTLMVRG
jgi:hypothetical protein